jgi:hypothetical protein
MENIKDFEGISLESSPLGCTWKNNKCESAICSDIININKCDNYTNLCFWNEYVFFFIIIILFIFFYFIHFNLFIYLFCDVEFYFPGDSVFSLWMFLRVMKFQIHHCVMCANIFD